MPDLDNRDVFAFFRMGLVTGLIDRQTVVAWADRALIKASEFELTELSLAGDFSYSRMVALLSDLQGPARYGISLDLLFARAGMLLERDPEQAADIIRGLRLLCAEHYLPAEIKTRLAGLDNDLSLLNKSELTQWECARRLSAFLDPYSEFRNFLGEFLP